MQNDETMNMENIYQKRKVDTWQRRVPKMETMLLPTLKSFPSVKKYEGIFT